MEQRSGKNKQASIQLAECVAQEYSIQVLRPESLVNIRDNNRHTQLVDESSQLTQGNSGIDAMDDSDDDEHFCDAVQYMNSEEAHSANVVSCVSSNHRKIQLNESPVARNQVFDQSTLWSGLKVQKAKNENNNMKARLQESESNGKGVESQKEKFFEASTNSKKQSSYPSVSFILSGVFAVGAILTIFNLAICIQLTVSALTFLAVGCYYSYKASTALSNIEVDQIGNCVNSAASGTQVT
ncbi:TomO hydrophobic C-terminal domain-containing protein [Wolbachia endosymbiont of Nasonia vitripennis]|uniref:TomO hydrophobic C-terminal domain-containing protein n=1 Tax=Wolbachia endosymbiont of Nasonia vitripennis TaxID=180837 RepID=UPI003A89251B